MKNAGAVDDLAHAPGQPLCPSYPRSAPGPHVLHADRDSAERSRIVNLIPAHFQAEQSRICRAHADSAARQYPLRPLGPGVEGCWSGQGRLARNIPSHWPPGPNELARAYGPYRRDKPFPGSRGPLLRGLRSLGDPFAFQAEHYRPLCERDGLRSNVTKAQELRPFLHSFPDAARTGNPSDL